MSYWITVGGLGQLCTLFLQVFGLLIQNLTSVIQFIYINI